MKRLLGAVAAALVFSVAAPLPSATGQDSTVTLRLVSQSPWCARYHRATLDMALEASNRGSRPLGDLRVDVSFGPHISTQSSYDDMLSSGVTTVIASSSKTVHGKIDPGVPRTIPMSVDLARIDALDQIDSQTYPAMVQLLSSDTVVASLVTPVIYLVQRPLVPMLSSVWVELSAPIAFGADGTLVDTSFPAAIASGGALRAPLDAIAATTGGRHPHGVLDMVLDPLAITQARDIADGYQLTDGTQVAASDPSARDAQRFLHRLAGATAHPDTLETVALPYADPVVPAMLTSGLSGELAVQRSAGAAVVSSLQGTTSVEATSVATVARPEGGRLSDAALAWLSGPGGMDVVLADAGTVDRSPWQEDLAPAPTVPVSTSSGAMTMVLPDPDTQALFERSDALDDPVRAAQIVLGELAVIWKQQPAPSPPTLRGVAVAPPADLPSDMWEPLLEDLSDAPFLTPVTASQLVDRVNPGNPNEGGPLVAPDTSAFDASYVAELERLTQAVQAYTSMLPSGSEVPIDLRRRLFLATAPPYLVDPAAGGPWLASVDDVTRRAFDSVAPTVSPAFTFTSREGTIPVFIGDPGDTPLRVTVELRSTAFTFLPPGNSQTVLVQRPGQEVDFRVVADASGQNPISLFVRAPNGQQIQPPPGEPPTTIVVRSTAVNRIALLVTIVAALGLVALYGRRWFRRRRTAT